MHLHTNKKMLFCNLCLTHLEQQLLWLSNTKQTDLSSSLISKSTCYNICTAHPKFSVDPNVIRTHTFVKLNYFIVEMRHLCEWAIISHNYGELWPIYSTKNHMKFKFSHNKNNFALQKTFYKRKKISQCQNNWRLHFNLWE